MNTRQQLVARRWGRLALSTAISLAGLSWLTVTYGAFMPVQAMGLVAAFIIALIARARRSERRLPAAMALVCAAPMAQLVLRVDSLSMWLLTHAAPAMIVVGSAATVVTALVILLARRAPPTPDPVARAVALPRSSE
jgi:hypothetical protein